MKWPLVLRSTYEAKCADCSLFIHDNLRLRQEAGKLRKQLEKALKNDTRDPATGRYMKGE